MEFGTRTDKWVANFRPGLGGIELVHAHPNQRDAVVVASCDLWVVDPEGRSAEMVLPAINAALEVQSPDGWLFVRQGIALARLGPDGIIWHTRRLSWDGFDQLVIAGDEVTGLAYSPQDDRWNPFRVDLRTGRSTGGSYEGVDFLTWERLAPETED